MYRIFTYIWDIYGVHVAKYSIHGAYGVWLKIISPPSCTWLVSKIVTTVTKFVTAPLLSRKNRAPKKKDWYTWIIIKFRSKKLLGSGYNNKKTIPLITMFIGGIPTIIIRGVWHCYTHIRTGASFASNPPDGWRLEEPGTPMGERPQLQRTSQLENRPSWNVRKIDVFILWQVNVIMISVIVY